MLDLLEIVFGHFDLAAMVPSFVIGGEVDVSMGDIGADDFPESAGAKLFFHVVRQFFDGGHKSLVIFVGEIVDFVDLLFRDDEGVAFGLGMNVEKSEGFIVFVDFVAGDVSVDNLGKNARHVWLLWLLF